MAENTADLELLQAARCEDLLYDQIRELTVTGAFEERVINTLTQMGAHRLEVRAALENECYYDPRKSTLTPILKQNVNWRSMSALRRAHFLRALKPENVMDFRYGSMLKSLPRYTRSSSFLDLIKKGRE